MKKFSAIVLGLALVGLTGCNKYGDYCKKARDCQGGNDKDQAACADLLVAFDKYYADYGCSDASTKQSDCMISKASCEDKHYSSGTSCIDEGEALTKCQQAATGVK